MPRAFGCCARDSSVAPLTSAVVTTTLAVCIGTLRSAGSSISGPIVRVASESALRRGGTTSRAPRGGGRPGGGEAGEPVATLERKARGDRQERVVALHANHRQTLIREALLEPA